jgi:hypothetical protein
VENENYRLVQEEKPTEAQAARGSEMGIPWQLLFRCGFDFSEAVAHYRFQGFAELSFDIDIFEDGEVGALFFFLEAALLSGDDNDGNVGSFRLGFESSDELAAAHLRHLHVSDNQVGAPLLQKFKRLLTISGGLDGEATLLKKAAHGVPYEHGIVNYQSRKRHPQFLGELLRADITRLLSCQQALRFRQDYLRHR